MTVNLPLVGVGLIVVLVGAGLGSTLVAVVGLILVVVAVFF